MGIIDKKESVKRCIKFIMRDIDVMTQERGFLRNLLIQMEIYHGLCNIGEYNSSQKSNIKRIMNFIAQHRVVSFTDLFREFLIDIGETDIDMIIKALISSEFICIEDNIITMIERKNNDTSRNDTSRNT